MSTIREFPSRTESTIVMRRQRRIDWHLETTVGVAGDGASSLLRCGSPTHNAPPPLTALRWLRSFLPTNRHPLVLRFSLDQLAKFVVFARKNVSTIREFSSRTESTIVMRRQRGIDWHLETTVGVAGDGASSLLRCGSPTHNAPPPLTALRWLRSFLPTNRHHLVLVVWRVCRDNGRSSEIVNSCDLASRERERSRFPEIEIP